MQALHMEWVSSKYGRSQWDRRCYLTPCMPEANRVGSLLITRGD